MSRGGAQLLADTACKTNDPQTLRMVAGALANLCGNGKQKMSLEYFVKNFCTLHMGTWFNFEVLNDLSLNRITN